MTQPKPRTELLWAELLKAQKALLGDLQGRLKAAGHPPIEWYDALWEIERAGADGVRPFELKERLLLPQYATSRLVDRLVNAGLVQRDKVDEDARGQRLRLTEAGADTRARMWPVYAQFLVSGIEDTLTPAEAKAALKALRTLRGRSED